VPSAEIWPRYPGKLPKLQLLQLHPLEEFRYSQVHLFKSPEEVLVRHTQADRKLERTRKQDVSRVQKELATEVTSKKFWRRVWLTTSVD
jgi:hypothetical protein